METQQQEIEQVACVRYQRTWEGYESSILSGGTSALSKYCKSLHVNYHGLTKWMAARGLSVRELKVKAREGAAAVADKSALEETAGLFVQFTPSRAASGPIRLRGVAISFPDGVGLTLQESTVEEVVALVDTYERRRSAREEAACSR